MEKDELKADARMEARNGPEMAPLSAAYCILVLREKGGHLSCIHPTTVEDSEIAS